MSEPVRKYYGKRINVSFDPRRCTHVGKCLRGLPLVFDKNRRPWVQPDAASADEVAAVVMQCPTGALHFERHDGGPEEPVPAQNMIAIVANGPLNLRGEIELTATDGQVLLRETRMSLCRCGATRHRPFCDNSHCDIGFEEAGDLTVNCFRSEKPLARRTLNVRPLSDGPLRCEGNVKIRSADKQVVFSGSKCFLCRCGASAGKPFCDGTHAYIGSQTELLAEVGQIRRRTVDYWPRFPLMILGLVSLFVALGAGLIRLGWSLPLLHPPLTVAHGPLMISGFLGLILGLKRVAAMLARRPAQARFSFIGRSWAYSGPLLVGLGALALIIGLPGWLSPLLITLGSIGTAAAFIPLIHQRPTLFTIILGLGALLWVIGNGLWLAGWPLYQSVPWWVGFMVLSILGDRLKFSRAVYASSSPKTFLAAALALLLAGLALSTLLFDPGVRLAYAALAGLALWLMSNDIDWPALRRSGLPRFLGLSLLAGYGWLAVGGLLGLRFGDHQAGLYYDAFLHAIFIGFFLSILFGHAPIFLAAVVGRSFAFQPVFYASLLLLHFSLLLRIGGDLAVWQPGRQWGGLLNVASIGLFLATIGYAIFQSRATPRAAVVRVARS